MLQIEPLENMRSARRFHVAGRLSEAERIYRQILAQQPDHAEALHCLGLIAYQAGRYSVAVDLIRRAISIYPNSPDFNNNLGLALSDNGDKDQAIPAFHRAIALAPNYPQPYYNLGNVLSDKGQLDQAIAAYDKAIALDPNFSLAYSNLGNVLKNKGQLDQAIAAYRKSIALHPNHAETHYNLGVALMDRGEFDPAIAAYQKAIEVQPSFGVAYNDLGIARQQLGDFQEAERCFRQGIRYDPNNALLHSNLAKLLGSNLPDKDLGALELLLSDRSASTLNQSVVHFGAAHVLDARQSYREAGLHLRLAHALCKAQTERQGAEYDPIVHARFISRMIQTCGAEFFQRVQGMGVPSQRPVFIIGLPRSGTTLTEQILAGHSQVFAAGELALSKKDFLSLDRDSKLASDFVRLGCIPDEESCFQGLERLDSPTIQRVANRHLDDLHKLNSSASRIVDKMYDNYIYLGLLAALFPEAKFIHCRRDLRDVAISCWSTQFETISWHHDLEHIADHFENYRRLMQHWRTVLEGRWLDFDYEQTVADLPESARHLIAWCGLDWEPACVDFYRVKRPVRTSSSMQVRQPLYDRSVGRWKHYQEALAPILDRLS